MKLKFDNCSLYLRAFTVNLVSFSAGIAVGWTSPMLPKLNGSSDPDNNPLGRPATILEQSWIAAILTLGSICGPLLGGLATAKLGRKKSIIILACPLLLSFIMLAFADNIVMFYVARIIAGPSVGSVFSLLPVYLAEIAENDNRGTLSCFLSIFMSLGILFTYTVGPFLTVQHFCLVCVIPLIIFFPVFSLWCTETPHYFASINDRRNLKITLLKLRNNRSLEQIEHETSEITKMVQELSQNKGGIKKLFDTKSARKGLLISAGLVSFQQLSGFVAVVSYMQTIFETSESELTPEDSAIIVAVVQVCVSSVSSTLVDRLGRRLLLLISASGTSLSLAILGAYFFFKDLYELDFISWLPLVTLMVYMICFNVGLGPVIWTVMGELFSPDIKSLATTLTAVIYLIVAFLVTLIFPYLSVLIGIGELFWVFAAICASAAAFIYFMLPETKGKSLLEIQELLE